MTNGSGHVSKTKACLGVALFELTQFFRPFRKMERKGYLQETLMEHLSKQTSWRCRSLHKLWELSLLHGKMPFHFGLSLKDIGLVCVDWIDRSLRKTVWNVVTFYKNTTWLPNKKCPRHQISFIKEFEEKEFEFKQRNLKIGHIMIF